MFNYADLLSKQYEMGGRGPVVYDCYGLLQEAYRRDWKVEIPNYPTWANPGDNNLELNRAAEHDWVKLLRREARCAVTFNIRGLPHVGYMLTDSLFIHCIEKRHVGVESIHSYLWKTTVRNFYQWKDVPGAIKNV